MPTLHWNAPSQPLEDIVIKLNASFKGKNVELKMINRRKQDGVLSLMRMVGTILNNYNIELLATFKSYTFFPVYE